MFREEPSALTVEDPLTSLTPTFFYTTEEAACSFEPTIIWREVAAVKMYLALLSCHTGRRENVRSHNT